MMTDKETVLMNAAQYFLTRKKYIDRYVEGEHKWYGDVTSSEPITYNSQPRPWYLDNSGCSKTVVGG